MLPNTALALVHNCDKQRLATRDAKGRGHTGTPSFLLRVSVSLKVL